VLTLLRVKMVFTIRPEKTPDSMVVDPSTDLCVMESSALLHM